VHGLLIGITPVSAAVFTEVSRTQQYARGLLEASLDALMVIDKDGALSDVNGALERFTGRARDALIGHPFSDLFQEADKARRGVEATFREGIVRNYELTMRGADGAGIPVSLNATVFRDGERVVQGIFAAARDISERKAMMRKLEEARNYSRGLIECNPDLMVTIDRQGVITDANQAAESMTGRPRGQIVGQPFATFFDEPERARAGVDLTFASGTVRDYALRLVGADGRTSAVAFNASLYPEQADGGQIVFAVARAK
jgi:PAS domain S-box-containing protein